MNSNKPDLTYKQVSCPDLRCSSGHTAPSTFKVDGPDGKEEPTRFFEIHHDGVYLGTFCEPCLIIANHMARLQKKQR